MDEQKIPLWRDDRFLKLAGQILLIVLVAIILGIIANNISVNFRRLGLNFGFSFLNNPALLRLAIRRFPIAPLIPSGVLFWLDW